MSFSAAMRSARLNQNYRSADNAIKNIERVADDDQLEYENKVNKRNS